MVTSTAGLACDASATTKSDTSKTQNNEVNANEFSEVGKASDEKSSNSVDSGVALSNDIQGSMSTDHTSTSAASNSCADSVNVTTATNNQRVEPQANGLCSSLPVTANGSIQTFVTSTYSSYGPNSQPPLSSTGKPGPNISNFQPSMQPRFPDNQPSSFTPTLNQLLATPSRFPLNSSESAGEQSTQNQADVSRAQRQSWEQDQTKRAAAGSISAPSNHSDPRNNSSSLAQPHQQPPHYPPQPSQHQSFRQNQPRHPAPTPASNQMPPYSQSQQVPPYNSSMPPPGSSSYSPAPPQQQGYPYQGYHNSPQQPYYARHPSPAQGAARMDVPQANTPQHLPDSPFQHRKEHMMSPNRRTSQPAPAVPSPMSAGSSPHMQGPLSSVPQFRGQSPSRASPALSVTSNTPLSPNLVRPGNSQLSPSLRGSDGTDSNKPSPVPPGYSMNYRSTASPSPFTGQTPNPSQGMMSPPHGSYPGNTQPPQQQGHQQNPIHPSALASGGKVQPSHGTVAQPYNPAVQQPPMAQQPGYNSPQYPGISQNQPPQQGYSSASPRPAPTPGSLPQSISDPGQAVRRGAAAAAAAAMAAAAHSAQPGHISAQRHNAPNYYGQTPPAQQLRTPHPNYSNVQAGGDVYQKPYRQTTPPRMPGGQHQMSSPGMQRMPPPGSTGYRHTSAPPEQYQGCYASGEHPSQPPPGYQTAPGGYNQQQPQQKTPEPVTKKPLARSLSQKLASLFEPPEPGRREFIEAVLKYWDEKEIPLKNAPLMGRKTLDLFRLFHIVKQRGGMQEVTARKNWPEISSMLGHGTTSTSGFTLKKQYCKYLYGFECKERGQPEPPEAMARMTEANRKSRKAIESANEEARMAAMSPHHLMQPSGPHSSYPPQSYPPGQYPHAQQYRPPPSLPGSTNPAYMSRTMTPRGSNYPPNHSNYAGGSVHHTNMPPRPQGYSTSQPISNYGQFTQQQPQQLPSSVPGYPPAPTSNYSPAAAGALPSAPAPMPIPNRPFVQQSHPGIQSSSTTFPRSSVYPPASTSPAFTGSTPPHSSYRPSVPSSYPSQISSTPPSTSIAPGSTPPSQGYPRPPYTGYRPSHPPGAAPSYPASNSPLPQARPPTPQQYLGSGTSPSPKPSMPYSPRSASPLRPPQSRTPNYPSTAYRPSSSPGLKRPGPDLAGPPPSKVFRQEIPNVLSSLPASLRPADVELKSQRRRFTSARSSSATSSSEFGSFRTSYSHRPPQYRMNSSRYPTPRPSGRWPQPNSLSSRPYSPHSYPQGHAHSDTRARRPLQLHRTPMAQQFKREYMQFPANSVEATPLRLTKYQRKTCNNVGLVESWRIIMALKSGLLVESNWALNVLNVFLYDQNSVVQFRLSQLPGLLDSLVDHYRNVWYDSHWRTQPPALKAGDLSIHLILKLSQRKMFTVFSNAENQFYHLSAVQHSQKTGVKILSIRAVHILTCRYLCELFTLPAEQEAIGIKPSIDSKDLKTNPLINEDRNILRQFGILSKKTTDRNILAKLNGNCTKYRIKIEPRRNPFVLDKSHHWDDIKKTGLYNDISHIVVMSSNGNCKEREKAVFLSNKLKDEEKGVVEATLEEVLSIPCTVLCPETYDVTMTSIEALKIEEQNLDKKIKLASKCKTEKIKSEPKEATNAIEKTQETSNTQIKTETDISNKQAKIPNDKIENTSDKNAKTKAISSSSKKEIKEKSKDETKSDQNSKVLKEINNNNTLVNGEATEEEKQNFQNKNNSETVSKSEVHCKMEVEDSKETRIQDQKPAIESKEKIELNKTVKIEMSDSETPPFKQENVLLETKVKQEPANSDHFVPKKSNYSFDIKTPSLIERVKHLMEERNVLLLEDEASGRDGSVCDPLSGPLLICESSSSKINLSNRLSAVSNILRSLSFIPVNHSDFCRHLALVKAVSGMILLRHKHKVRRKRKLDFENVEELKQKIQKTSLADSLENLTKGIHLENNKCRINSLKNKSNLDKTDSSTNECVSDTDIKNKSRERSAASSELFAPIEEELFASKVDLNAFQKSSFSDLVLDERKKDVEGIYEDPWWWDSVQKIREDALVILSNISTTLDFSVIPDDSVSLSMIDACLHLTLCPSSDACDSYSYKPRNNVSPQRLALEILTKLSIKDHNVQLILAARPFSKLEKLFAFLIKLICDRKDQALQEFAIVLLSNLSRNDQSIARIIALQKSSISCLINFLEACEETAINNRDCLRLSSGVTNCGSTEFMMTKAAWAIHTLASVPENKPSFMKYQLRLLALSMSKLLGNQITSILSSVLFELTRESQ